MLSFVLTVALVAGLATASSGQVLGETTEDQQVFPSDPQNEARFGLAIAVEGDTFVVGAHFNSEFTGAAYVFTRTGNTWTQTQRLVAGDARQGDGFGSAVVIEGDTMVVGARTADPLPGIGEQAGAAYVFTRTGNTWTQTQQLVAGDPQESGRFGVDIAIDGDTMVIGAPALDDVAQASYVFTRTANTWTQTQKLTVQDPDPDRDFSHAFGTTVAIDGDTAVIGNGSPLGTLNSAAFVFTRTANTWTQTQQLVANDQQPLDFFGSSIAIEGDTIVVGARESRTATLPPEGAAFVFTRTSNTWTQTQRIIDDVPVANDRFGSEVAIDGDAVLIGGGVSSPAVNVFAKTGDTWIKEHVLVQTTPEEFDFFGFGLAIDGETVISSAALTDVGNVTNAGSAYVFTIERETGFCNGEEVTVDLADGDRPTDGDDVILGTDGADVISAGDGNDLICAEGGDDIINAGNGADTVFAGSGDDTVNAGQGRDFIDSGAGDDFVSGGKGKDTIDGGAGDDDLRGNEGTDTLNGGSGNDELRGGQKADTINGGSGDDNLVGGTRPDRLSGGRGLDAFNGGGSLTDECFRDPDGLSEQFVGCEILS